MNVVKWNPHRIDSVHRVLDLEFHYAAMLQDPLDWGPQHPDLTTQRLLRSAYFGELPSEEQEFGRIRRALRKGEEVTFWCEPVLASCLCVLWALETLARWGMDLHNVSLALSSGRTDIEALEPEAVRLSIKERIPAGEVLDPLLAVRRHLASDDDQVQAELSQVPPPLRDWIGVTERLVDFLPDERGLDLIDETVLDRLVEEAAQGEEWPTAAAILGRARDYPDGHALQPERLWERLLQLSGFSRTLRIWHPDKRNRLVEPRLGSEATFGESRFRITELGRRARAGEVDALPLCSFTRWVGGRQVSRERALRRSAADQPRT